MSLYAPSLNYIWKSFTDLGLDTQRLFEEAGIDPSLRLDVTARVSAQQVDELLWHARQQSNDDAFVFKLAAHLHPSYLGALGYAWMTSATLRKAFERLSRHTAMVWEELRVRLEDRDDAFHVIFESDETGQHDPAMRELGKLAMAVQLCRMNYGEGFNPTCVRFQQAQPANAPAHYEFFRCELFFDEAVSELEMPIAVADEELPGFNPQLVHTFDELIIDYLRQRDLSDIVGRTRAAIFEELPSGEISLDKTAKMLHMSRRSLGRKLAEEGELFKNLLAAVRRELAEKYIRDRSLTLTDICFLLGFSESSSFSRAYRSWSGQSPSAHRGELFTHTA